MTSFTWTGDAAMLAEQEPDGSRGAREAHTKRLELRVMGKEIQDGFGTGCALEMSWRSIADGKDTLDDERIEARGRLRPGAGAAVKDAVIVGKGSAEAVSPLLHPGERAMGGSSVVGEGP
jgi:hypothetical protein